MKEGLTENGDVDLGGNLDKYILLPLCGINQVRDREGNVSCVIFFVLFKDNVAPGLVEISGCHTGVTKAPEDWNQLDIYKISLHLSFVIKDLPVIVF